MAEEFQEYFYVSHKDLKSPQPGKLIGYVLVMVFIVLLLLKMLFKLRISWTGLLLILGFGIVSLMLGRMVHNARNGETEEDDPERRNPKDPPSIIEEGHSL